jgi:hypothetical protein
LSLEAERKGEWMQTRPAKRKHGLHRGILTPSLHLVIAVLAIDTSLHLVIAVLAMDT